MEDDKYDHLIQEDVNFLFLVWIRFIETADDLSNKVTVSLAVFLCFKCIPIGRATV